MTPEIFNKTHLQTTNLRGGSGGLPNITGKDVLLACQGMDQRLDALREFVLDENQKARHSLWGALFISAMNHPEIQTFQKSHIGAIKLLTIMAIEEMNPTIKIDWTHNYRAWRMGISTRQWHRSYKNVYNRISLIPHYWMQEMLEVAEQRLYG